MAGPGATTETREFRQWGPVPSAVDQATIEETAAMSDVQITGPVRQQGAALTRDGDYGRLAFTREGAQQINSREGLVDLWTRAGRVFTANNPVIGQPETMSAAGTALTLTAPSIRLTVPAGLMVVPIHVQLKTATVIAKDDIFAVIIGETDTYSSGGDAILMTARNAVVQNNQQIMASRVSNLHYSDTAIVEAALVRARIAKILKREGQTAEVDTTYAPEYNILKGDAMFYVEGPASILVFHVQETTAAEDEWSMSWAELDPPTVSGT